MKRLLGWVLAISLATSALGKAVSQGDHRKDIDLLMPDVQPQEMDTYLCHSMKVDDQTLYITGFSPQAKMETAHHILLFGCGEPGDSAPVWDCGEMHSSTKFKSGPVCKDEPSIIYAWAMDAPELKLPEKVAFKVGRSTDIKFLVVQVHYKDVTNFLPPKSEKDHSGIILHTTDIPQPKLGGVYLLGTTGEIPAKSTTYMETACSYNEPVELHPFAFRTHAHTHGEVVAGFRVRDGVWTEIGRKSPKLPQMFYNVTTPGLTIKSGDILAARCTMVNNESRTIRVGSTSNDEMCNFYVMYYVDGDRTADNNFCFTAGPPSWNWLDFDGIHPENAPRDASIIPGTDQFLTASEMINEVEDNMREESEKMNEEFERMMNRADGIGEEYDTEDRRMNNINSEWKDADQYYRSY